MRLIPLLIILVLLGSQSCTRLITKNIQVTDSTAIKSLQDSISFHKKLNEELSTELNLAQLSGVKFDTLFVPGDTVVNTITIREGGELIATGRIKSASVSKDFSLRLVKQKQQQVDSLAKLLAEERKTVKVVDREVEKKTRVFVGWWLLVIGFLGGLYVGVRYKDFFTKIV